MLSDKHTFERRHVLYCDILGFSSYMTSIWFEKSRCFRLFHALDEVIRQAHNKIDPSLSDSETGLVADYVVNPEATYCSDSIIISTPSTNIDAMWLCEAASNLQNAIAHLGFLLRGAITTGDLYHSGNTIFGPAIAGAVQLEKSIEIPAICLSNETYTIFHQISKVSDGPIVSAVSSRLLSTFNSSLSFADPFWRLRRYAMMESLAPEPSILFDSWRNLIERGLQHEDLKTFKKYVWTAEYFNQAMCNKPSNILPISIPIRP